MDQSRYRLNKSVNRYEINSIDHYQINKSFHWQLNKPNKKFTIDF